MQIQRIQNLYLLLSFIAAIISINFNWLVIGDTSVTIRNDYTIMVLAVVATLLPLLGLFRYKSLRVQKLISRLSALFAIFSVGYVVVLSYLGPNPEAEICVLAPSLMAISGLLDCLAIRGIIHDEKLLKSADRLR